VNQAVNASSGQWVLLLNPDTELHPGAIDIVVRFAERNPANGIYGGRTLRGDGSVEISSCWALPTVWSTFCFATGLAGSPLPSRFFDPDAMGWWPRDSVREVGMVTGCFLLTPRAVWDALGGLDERYFVYGEDADFAARARRAGYRPIITPDAVLLHEVGASSSSGGAKMVLLLAGKITFVQQQWTGWRRGAGIALLRGGAALHMLVARTTGHGERWIAAWADRRRWWDGYPDPA
jgi:GT2 family glycosyltransferase